MFVKNKYIFETKVTRFKRYILNILIFISLSFFTYSLSCIVLYKASIKKIKESENSLYKKPPDLIIVYTGHHGRIKYGIKQAEQYDHSQIIISGVHHKNYISSIMKPFKNLDTKLWDIDYKSKNTLENVLSTYRYLKDSPGIKRILIISHDYHIMRIHKIINSLKSPKDNEKYTFFYKGVKTNYKKIRNIKILYKELFKLIRTYIFLIFWNPSMDSI